MKKLPVNPGMSRQVREWYILEHGMIPVRNITIVRGVFVMEENIRGGGFFHTDNGIYILIFFARTIPPEVRSGDRIAVVANLSTADAGTKAVLTDALIVSEGYTNMMQEMREVLKRGVIDPKTYIHPSEVEP